MSGRIRTIKPEILEDAKTAGLSHADFRMFVGMIVIADDYGNLRASTNFIFGQIFWTVAYDDIDGGLQRLAEADLIELYSVRGQPYAHIRGWMKHQKVQHRGKPRVPTIEEAEPEKSHETLMRVSGESHEDYGESHESLTPDLRSPTTTTTSDQRPLIASRRTSRASKPAPTSPPVLLFDTVGAEKQWALTEDYVARLREAFPEADVVAECIRARVWLGANGLKTPRGMERFLFGWLSKSANWRTTPPRQRQQTSREQELFEIADSWGERPQATIIEVDADVATTGPPLRLTQGVPSAAKRGDP